jgi:hypothetical protein
VLGWLQNTLRVNQILEGRNEQLATTSIFSGSRVITSGIAERRKEVRQISVEASRAAQTSLSDVSGMRDTRPSHPAKTSPAQRGIIPCRVSCTHYSSTLCSMHPAPSELKGRYTMSMRFIRWILPLLVVLTIAIVFAVMVVTGAHAAGLTPLYQWRG